MATDCTKGALNQNIHSVIQNCIFLDLRRVEEEGENKKRVGIERGMLDSSGLLGLKLALGDQGG